MIVFKMVDKNDTALEMYVNDSNELYIGMYDDNEPEDSFRWQTMSVDKQDVIGFIEHLQKLVKDVN